MLGPAQPVSQVDHDGHVRGLPDSDPKVQINLRYGGNGPPVLLLHGCPLTLAHRHLVGLNFPASGRYTAWLARSKGAGMGKN